MSESLPAAPTPQGRYTPAVVHRGIAMSAGMTPRQDGRLLVRGLVGRDVDTAEARDGAALAARNALAAISAKIGGIQHIERCLRMTVYIAIVDGFEDLSLIADAASEALAEHFGARFQPPVRSAIGVRGLPSGAAVEIELTVAVTVE